ncbi:hypothetical protein [Streptomyces leeuwenhoekii]|uniref:Uncharacterized protein n=1 Tax=Streptomyces leeuwenhoekii TaxID=1437453 RepID=A0A0F7VNJ7_STRLW|nr:hypothetical protein [Streptomyces leeuwenhoekii]CQR59818.1 Hypothetical Protein sle_03560 [Streptomyces leeuwenhoekii]
MSNPHEDKLSHPLEQVTGEKDVHPEEEGAPRPERAARSEDERPGTERPGEEGTSRESSP